MNQRVLWQTPQSAVAGAQAREERQLYFTCKRILDISVSAVGLLALLPLLVIVAVLIVLDTPGPAIFCQERVGLKRKRGTRREAWQVGMFTMYKFRTMYRDSQSDAHRAFVEAFIDNDTEKLAALQGEDTQVRKLVHDARITGLGKLLRKTSLDEVPQLWNVLKGDMSLVGPRPPIPYEVDMYQAWHHQRLAALPGVTGLWQVTARSSADFDEMVKLDLHYIEHQSFWLDLKILLKTPLVVLGGNGAE